MDSCVVVPSHCNVYMNVLVLKTVVPYSNVARVTDYVSFTPTV